jgi:Uncharacterised ArCR, COG2043
MSRLSVREVGQQLAKAGRLELKPLCIYASDTVPSGVVKVSDMVKTGNRCFAKALLLVAAGEADGVYLGKDVMSGVCKGSLGWLGLVEFSEDVCNMLSTGSSHPMYLKETAAGAAWTLKKMGKVHFPAKYLVMQACDKAGDVTPLSYLCLGNAEQIRNLCGLIHFGSDSPFGQIDAAWGSFCATFIAYPAGMAAGAPKDTAFIGPMGPDGNTLLLPDMMTLGIPAKMAARMADDVEKSFAAKCPDETWPAKRDAEVIQALKHMVH